MSIEEETAIRLVPSGVSLGGRVVPFHSGSVHYFALSRNAWRPALESVKALGARFVDTVVPWGVHETAKGAFDFGEREPRRDVARFLKLASELELFVVIRPGPCVDAGLEFGGIPERVAWDDACQARSGSGAPVLIPKLPRAEPVPSPASRTFHDEATVWLRAVAQRLGSLVWPRGPIALLGLDAHADGFAMGPYDRDYHPDAIDRYRRFLLRRYETVGALRRSHRDESATFEAVEPPRLLDTSDPDSLAPHLDWSEFHEALDESVLYRRLRTLREGGFAHLPVLSGLAANLGTRLNDPCRLERVGTSSWLEIHSPKSKTEQARVNRRVTELSTRAEARGVVPIATVGAGFAAFSRSSSEADDERSVLTALAHGVRGVNVRMAVARDGWVGGPVDAHGRARRSATFLTRLFAALERTRFAELRRFIAVRIIVPGNVERLMALTRVFAPIDSVQLADRAGAGFDAALEGELDPTNGALRETAEFVTRLAEILDGAGVAYAVTGTDLAARAVESASWTVIACAGALEPRLVASLGERMLAGGRISFGPRVPERDDHFRAPGVRLPSVERPAVPICLPAAGDELVSTVEDVLRTLDAPRLVVEPSTLRASLHVAANGRPAALFVWNFTDEHVTGRVRVSGVASAACALTNEAFSVANGAIHVPLDAGEIRFLLLE